MGTTICTYTYTYVHVIKQIMNFNFISNNHTNSHSSSISTKIANNKTRLHWVTVPCCLRPYFYRRQYIEKQNMMVEVAIRNQFGIARVRNGEALLSPSEVFTGNGQSNGGRHITMRWVCKHRYTLFPSMIPDSTRKYPLPHKLY